MTLRRRPAPDPREETFRSLGERLAEAMPPPPPSFADLLDQLDTKTRG